jgi:hypothetical protein
MHNILKFVYLIYLSNGHYNSFLSYYYKYILLDYGLGLKFGTYKLIDLFYKSIVIKINLRCNVILYPFKKKWKNSTWKDYQNG